MITLRGFSGAGAAEGTRRIGGEIFSKVKTGMVNPSTLVAKPPSELPWNFHPKISLEAFHDSWRHETFKPV